MCNTIGKNTIILYISMQNFIKLWWSFICTLSIIHLQAFYFPENVSFSIGGPSSSRYMVVEMHYDNPTGASGTLSIITWLYKVDGMV